MDEFRGEKILITGGLGFIGSNLAIRLVEAGASVTIVDSLYPTCGANYFNVEPIRNDIEIVEGDVADLTLMRRLVRGKKYVFNLAGHVSHIESMDDPFSDLHMNALAPLSLLEACRHENRGARVVYAGTRQSYGRPESLPLVETQPLKPIDVNGVTKMAGEWFHMVYDCAHGISAISLRLVNTYGPRQLVKHSRQGFVGWFIKQAIDGEQIQIFGDGQQLRGFNYIDDVADALLIAATDSRLRGDYFNLGGERPVTLESFVQLLLRITGRGSYRLVPFPSEKKAIDIGSVYTSAAKFNRATGWTPRITLEEGLTRTVDYYRRSHAHYW
ncbi:MAG: NAD-dependent epimerase [Acidobacteria bacterium]|nr:MAG: NAD-dependent epimerase [Acidobacteriota bacterium]PYS13059.1 MAG: NAD-dependent epimerase [Acidobacteriota bacterium]